MRDNSSSIDQFIAEHFITQNAEGDNPAQYTLKGTQISLTSDQIEKLKTLMKNHHYDGRLHHDAPSEIQPETFSQSALKKLKQNILSPAFFYQLLNLLEVTAVVTAIWEKDPKYKPDAFMYMGLAQTAIATLISGHYYAAALGGLSQEEIKTAKEAMGRAHNTLHDELKNIFSNPENREEHPAIEKLLYLLTKPTRFTQTETLMRSMMSFSVKLAASAALFLQEGKNLPLYAVAALAALSGTMEGVDMAFNNVVAIGGEHRDILNWQQGIIPPIDDSAYSPLFSRFADFPVIPWMMAKAGPALWAAVKTMSAVTLARLLGLNESSLRGGLTGVYGITGISAMVFSSVYSRYNVDEKLAKHLPTKRTFEINNPNHSNAVNIATAAASALPAAAIPASMIYLFAHSLFAAAATGVATLALMTAVIIKFQSFAKIYSTAAEFRFVAPAFEKLDNLHPNDKIALSVIGAFISAAGLGLNSPAASGIGQTTLFYMLSSLVANRSQAAANIMRFVPAQMMLYSAAIITWTLNFLIPMHNVFHGESPQDRPATFSREHFGDAKYFGVLFLALTAGALGGFKDYAATFAKLPLAVLRQHDSEPAEQSLLNPSDNTAANNRSYTSKIFSRMSNGITGCCDALSDVLPFSNA